MTIELPDSRNFGGTGISDSHIPAFWEWMTSTTNGVNANTVSTAANATAVSLALTPGVLVGKVVHVASKADLPAAVGGKITLKADQAYVPLDLIDLGTDVLICAGHVTIAGHDDTCCGFITSSTSPLLTQPGGGVSLGFISLTNNDTGKCLDITGAAGQRCVLDHVVVANGARDTLIGVSGSLGLTIRNSRWSLGVDGIAISGSWTALVMRTVAFLGLAPTAIMTELVAGLTLSALTIVGCGFLTGNAGQTGLAIATGILPTAAAEVAGNTFAGPGVYLDGVDQPTIGWWFSSNPGISDSAAIGEINFDSNVTPTVITDGASWHLITGSTFTLSTLSERFVEVSEGKLQYKGKDPRRMVLFIEMTIETATNNKTCNVRVQVYDASTTSVSTLKTFNVDIRATAQPQAVSKAFIIDLHQDDYVYLEIGSNDGTNMTVLEAGLLSNAA